MSKRKYSKRQEIPLATRFWAKVNKTESCWLWTGSLVNGRYGHIRSAGRGKLLFAHRVSWQLHNGQIPEGMSVLHNCPGGDNTRCVNPAHLWLGTYAENMNDAAKKARVVHKITPKDVVEIRELVATGLFSQDKIGKAFGVSHAIVSRIIAGLIWKHVS